MTMQFEPGKDGKSGKLLMSIDKITINGSEEFMGQKLTPADFGFKDNREEIPLGFQDGSVLKNIVFSGKDIKFDIDVKNVKLADIG